MLDGSELMWSCRNFPFDFAQGRPLLRLKNGWARDDDRKRREILSRFGNTATWGNGLQENSSRLSVPSSQIGFLFFLKVDEGSGLSGIKT